MTIHLHLTITVQLVMIFLLSEHAYSCISTIVFINKSVEGSGSKGTPKYTGEGVTYGVFLGINRIFSCVCAPSDVPHQVAHTLSYHVMM